MLNAAMVLGIIAGIGGMVIGFFGYGFAEMLSVLGDLVGEVETGTGVQTGLAAQGSDDPVVTKVISLLAPILAIAGGAMAREKPLAGALMMGASAAGMFHGFGFGVFTMFPIAMAGLGALLALPAGLSGNRQG